MRKLRVLIAGCGSTGGACIEPLARLGVENFLLADSGEYELNNLNRQHARLEALGQNKAAFHASEVRSINPYANVDCRTSGLTPENVGELVEGADLIMDAVDVTTDTGIRMKLALHEHAHREKKPVLTALDLGFCQWGKSYDYRLAGAQVLDGNLERARRAKHPIAALLAIAPVSAIPGHSLDLFIDLLERPEQPASQLGIASDMLSPIIGAVAIRFVESGELVQGWDYDLGPVARPNRGFFAAWFGDARKRARLLELLRRFS